MIITQASAKNFQSYETIDFSYNKLGLCLVSGPTGAGKSTLLDLVPWVLYGETSKDGASDDVRSWGSDQLTIAVVRLSLPDGDIMVDRRRGTSKQNELFWCEIVNDILGPIIRGKDIKDTQTLLEARLGVSSELFMLGSYMTQFSKADTFFTASAKDRRKVLEKIADQSFAINLGEKTAEARKVAKKERDALELETSNAQGRLDTLNSTLADMEEASAEWKVTHQLKIDNCHKKLNNFSSLMEKKSVEWIAAQQRRILNLERSIKSESMQILEAEDLLRTEETLIGKLVALRYEEEHTCPTCGALKSDPEIQTLNNELMSLRYKAQANQAALSRSTQFLSTLEDTQKETNPYSDTTDNPHGAELEALKKEVDPILGKMTLIKDRFSQACERYISLQSALEESETRVSHLSWLYDKSFQLRGMMMERAVDSIARNTNLCISRFFNAVLHINLTLSDSDKLEVEILNKGHKCPFTSLSGGERCILKLAFTLSLMRAAQDKAGVAFNLICLDEPFNGLDEALKEQAFGLLQELSTQYPTVLVIEHAEAVKNLFHTKFLVDNSNGQSTLTRDE